MFVLRIARPSLRPLPPPQTHIYPPPSQSSLRGVSPLLRPASRFLSSSSPLTSLSAGDLLLQKPNGGRWEALLFPQELTPLQRGGLGLQKRWTSSTDEDESSLDESFYGDMSLDDEWGALDLQAKHLDATKMGQLVALCLREKDERVDTLIKEMVSRNMVSPRMLGKVQAMYSNRGDVKKVKEYMQLMKRNGGVVHPKAHNRVIHAYVRSQGEESAFAVLDYLDEMQQMGVEPDNTSITTAMQAWAKRGRVDRVLDLWEKMKEKGMDPQEATFNTILSAFAHQKGLSNTEAIKAKGIFLEMQRFGYQPSETTVNVMVKIVARQKGGKMGMAFLKEVSATFNLERGSVQPYNTVISAFIREGELEKATELMKELQERGEGDRATRHTLLNACVRAKDLKALVRSFKMVIQSKDKDAVDLYTWNTLLNGFANSGDINTQEAILREMEKSGFKPDSTTYSTLLKSYLGAKMFDKAEEVFDAARIDSPEDPVLYNTFISTYLREGDFEKAHQTFVRMQEDGVLGDHVTYNSLINGCGGDVEKAKKYYNEMVEAGVEPNAFTLNSMLQMYLKASSLSGGLAFYKEFSDAGGCNPADVVTYNILINMYRREKRTREAIEIFHKMKEDGFPPTVPTYNTMVSVADTMQDFGLAKMFYDEMKGVGLQPNLKTYSGLIRTCRSRPKLARWFYDEAVKDGLRPDIILFYYLLQCVKRTTDLTEESVTLDFLTSEMEKWGVKKDNNYRSLEVQAVKKRKRLALKKSDF